MGTVTNIWVENDQVMDYVRSLITCLLIQDKTVISSIAQEA